VLACVFLDTVGFGIILPVTPKLIMEVSDATLGEATRIGGWLLFVFAILQFACGPLIGNLSDRFGRRPVLLASMFCFGIDYLIMALAPSLLWLFIGRAAAGVAGAVYAPANAFIADVTPPQRRAHAFGLMGAAFGIGFIVGPAIGGLLGEFGTRAPFFAAALLAGINFLYGAIVLPETLAPERRRAFSLRRANPLGTLVAFARHPGLLGMAFAMLLWQLAFQVYPSTWSFYAMAKFNWSPGEIGASLAYTGIFMAFVQGFLVGRVVARIGERAAATIGMVSACGAFLAYAFVTRGWMVYAIMTFAALQALAYPSLNAIMSKRVPAGEQGELQGGNASIAGISTIVGTVAMTQALGHFSDGHGSIHFPGAAFLLAAVLAMLSLAAFRFGAAGRVVK
jgi:DHA1 family tetracycline resistance protein-like MFS transporter